MLVSVVIPTYNRAKTIERTVDSVLAQTWKQIEIIVVNDGSTDGTIEVLKRYKDRIQVVSQKNAGPAAARNTGIKAARGEIISFLDSDDTWLPGKAERQVCLLERTKESGVVCCVCNARMFFSSGTITSFEAAQLHPDLAEGIWSNPANVLLDRFLLFNQVAAVRREALAVSGFFREDLSFGPNEDYDLSLRLALVGPWAFIAEPLVEWHEHGGNISQTYRQLEVCIRTRQILEDIKNSPRFGRALPQAILNRRLRSLKEAVFLLRLEGHKNPAKRIFGRSLHLCLRAREALWRRISPPPQMLTRKA